MAADRFSPHIEAVARKLCGEPNARLSGKEELRFGTFGSLSVDLVKGTFFDHEAQEGGGLLDLVERFQKVKGSAAVAWLREVMNLEIEDDRAARAPDEKARIVATYDYTDEDGELLFQAVRFEPKRFAQRRPDPSKTTGWQWSIGGVRQVPYRLPELIEAIALEQLIFIVEGEKDVDALARINIPATCNAMGAGKWPPDLTPLFKGADVVILPDNDEAGRNHAKTVGASLQGFAKRVRVLNLPDLPPKGDVSDWLASGGDELNLYVQVERHSRPWASEPPESRFGAVIWSRLDQAIGRRDWLVEDILFTGDFGLNYGASQSGKSFLSVDMGLAIARGIPWLGKKTRKGGVIYQAGEGGLGLVNRLKAYRQHYGLTADLPFILLPKRVDLFDDNAELNADALIAEIEAWRPWLSDPLSLVVVDTYATATPGANENASEDVSRSLRSAQRIQEATKAAVLFVHHKNAGGEKPRGHTSLYANADTALEVIRDELEPEKRTLRIAKVKDGEDGERIGFKLQSVTIGAYDDGKPITSCVVVPAQVGDSRTGPRRPTVSSGQWLFLSTLDDAITQFGGILPPNIHDVEPGTYGVQWEHFVSLYKALRNATHDHNAIRQALRRDGEALIHKGLIEREDFWLWLTPKGYEEALRNRR